MQTDLHIIALVVVTALSKQPVVDYIVNIQLVQQRVTILHVRRVSRMK